MRPLSYTLALLLLVGCAKSPAERETADDMACRRIVAERNDKRPNAYQECRGNLMEYERQRSLRASGGTTIIQSGRNPLCGIGSQAAGMSC